MHLGTLVPRAPVGVVASSVDYYYSMLIIQLKAKFLFERAPDILSAGMRK
jgi:hypothetical protein